MSKNVNQKSLHLFVLVILCASTFFTAGWLIGSALGGVRSQLFGGLSGWVGAAVGGEVGYRKGFFEAKWDRLVMGGPWVGYAVVALIASMAELPGVAIVFSAVFGAGIGALVAKYLLRFFEHDPPLSIK
jgi:hypothetical protein